MFRAAGLLMALALVADGERLLAQVGGLNPAGFLDPRGSAYMGTANPPNAPLAPTGSSSLPLIGGSTLPPGAPGYYYNSPMYSREVEVNPALRQEVRRPFGGGGYRGGGRAAPSQPSPDGGDAQDKAQAGDNLMNFSERQMAMHAAGYRDNAHGRATGELGNDWRYVYFQRHHWYWMPNNTWAIWDHDRWVPHAQYLRGQDAQVASAPVPASGTPERRSDAVAGAAGVAQAP